MALKGNQGNEMREKEDPRDEHELLEAGAVRLRTRSSVSLVGQDSLIFTYR